MTGDLQFREIHGYRRAFRMFGDGPPLLLIHGIADSSETWLPVLPALAEHHTVRAAADPGGQAITMLDRSYHARRARQALPGSALEIFEGAGHFPHHHDPARFASLVTGFLRDTEPDPFDRRMWQEALREGHPAPPGASSGA